MHDRSNLPLMRLYMLLGMLPEQVGESGIEVEASIGQLSHFQEPLAVDLIRSESFYFHAMSLVGLIFLVHGKAC